jgi:hypothetical protein
MTGVQLALSVDRTWARRLRKRTVRPACSRRMDSQLRAEGESTRKAAFTVVAATTVSDLRRLVSIILLCPSGLNLHIEAEFHFCDFLYPPNTFGILRDTIRWFLRMP